MTLSTKRALTWVLAVASFVALAGPAGAQDVPPDQAVLYVVRVDSTPLLDTAFVFANERILRPYLFGKQYARHELTPGEYLFVAGGAGGTHPKKGWVHGNLEAGKTYGVVILFNNKNPMGGQGWRLFPLDRSFKNYDRAMELINGKAPKELDAKKQEKAEKQYQKMRERDEKRRSKGKPTWYEGTRDAVEARESKNSALRRELRPMAETPEPPAE